MPATSNPSSTLSRRNLLKGAGVVGAAFALPQVATPAFAINSQDSSATLVGTAPDAAALANYGYGSIINTLFPYQGRLYYGYGDYNSNSGSASRLGTNVSYYDPSTQTWGRDYTNYRTEEINTYRSFGGKLFAPSVDPSVGAPHNNSFVSNVSGVWAASNGAPGIHLYDVCDSTVAGEYFLGGAASAGGRGAAVVWTTKDYGVTWSELFTEPLEEDAYRDGFERIYWLTRIGNKIYFRANKGISYLSVAPLRWFDTRHRTWGTVNDANLDAGGYLLGESVYQGSAVVRSNGYSYFEQMGATWAFNGVRAIRIEGGSLTVGDDGYVYNRYGSVVQKITGTTTRSVALVHDVPPGPFTVLNRRIYMASGSDIWSQPIKWIF